MERFIGLFSADGRSPGREDAPDRSQPGNQRSAFRQLRADLARAVDANLDLVRRAFDLYAGAVDRLLSDESSSDPGEPRHLKLPQVLPGYRASSTLWIHNTTPAPALALRLHGSGLVSHRGESIGSESWTFEPGEIDIAPPGSSLPVAVTLQTRADLNPGVYRGYVFVTNLPAEFMTVEIEVVQPMSVDEEERWRGREQAS